MANRHTAREEAEHPADYLVRVGVVGYVNELARDGIWVASAWFTPISRSPADVEGEGPTARAALESIVLAVQARNAAKALEE